MDCSSDLCVQCPWAAELSADGGTVYLLDQLALPTRELYRSYDDAHAVATAISEMVVRGAPAIGIAAAYGMALAARAASELGADHYVAALVRVGERMVAARPTAVNLAWAVDRCVVLARSHAAQPGHERADALVAEARSIHAEDVAACRTMGAHGAARLPERAKVLTHCNAGALATGGYGTALGVVRAGWEANKVDSVIATETRPFLQGARLTAWELARDGVDVTVISDSMVAHCMKEARINVVVVGADRIARNGDVANKIGTYGIACLAKAHGIPMFVAAPWSTVDLATPNGEAIPIEQRAPQELTHVRDVRLVAEAAEVYNPAFDVTPAGLIDAIITERGVFDPSSIVDGDAAC